MTYLDHKGAVLEDNALESTIAFSVYDIELRSDLVYQPHPAFVKKDDGAYRFHDLSAKDLEGIQRLQDFGAVASRPVTADDYLYQIKRLAHPEVHSPVAEMMADLIVGLRPLGERLALDFEARRLEGPWFDLRPYPLEGVEVLDAHHIKIKIKGKYPQFRFWLAMPFFAPMPFEADAFYAQPELKAKNITLDWYPVGSGPYQLTENNPNRRMVLERNPSFHEDLYPRVGEPKDRALGLLKDGGQRLPLIDKVTFVLEKETIPYWSKFLQGYYDASGLASDNFDQAIQFSGVGQAELTEDLLSKGIHLDTAVTASIFYLGFNMQDPVVGGLDPAHTRLRQAISLAIDEEEFIAIFMNGRGVPAQGMLPPGIFGHLEGEAGMNPVVYDWVMGSPKRKPLSEAERLLQEAGYPHGIDPKTQQPLVLYLDTTMSGADDKPLLNWYRKQLGKIGLQLVLRTTDYNQFQQKMANGNAQLFRWGWNADYPDPENFFFLLYGDNAKASKGGENAANYKNPEFDRWFLAMRAMDDDEKRLEIIQKMQAIVRDDAPWVFGVHPKSFSLRHAWYRNYKPNLMANNGLKYLRIDAALRAERRAEWNQPIFWPLALGLFLLIALIWPAWRAYRLRMRSKAR